MDQGEGGDQTSRFDMLAASIRADASDLGTFMDALALKLESALPGMVRVEREGLPFKKERRVKRIRIQIEDKLFEVYKSATGLEARLSHQVRGITLKNELLHLNSWISELSQHLARHAESSAEAHAAMQKLIT